MAKYKYVDIAHSCGYAEKGHAVELGAHVRHSEDNSVEDHLRVRPCPKCKIRGIWSWTAGAKPEPKAAPKETACAKPEPKA